MRVIKEVRVYFVRILRSEFLVCPWFPIPVLEAPQFHFRVVDDDFQG